MHRDECATKPSNNHQRSQHSKCLEIISRHRNESRRYRFITFGLSNFDNDAQTNEAIGYPMAAMCVRMSSDQSVLHFTPINVASYVLPRPASRVIHHWQ
ncbi:hypothetical protein DERF_004694 [Dermatophagoides farinae]|uniref:Uncharacterized protein n=1 Tax=Dermatophagoides farinae TaxID=6954 RepID=A0A922I1Z4_DERFA|nr:hypothetical protein DERF_004694 [Dermatophagoides farinae]